MCYRGPLRYDPGVLAGLFSLFISGIGFLNKWKEFVLYQFGAEIPFGSIA